MIDGQKVGGKIDVPPINVRTRERLGGHVNKPILFILQKKTRSKFYAHQNVMLVAVVSAA
jgi:hypothetical protein